MARRSYLVFGVLATLVSAGGFLFSWKVFADLIVRQQIQEAQSLVDQAMLAVHLTDLAPRDTSERSRDYEAYIEQLVDELTDRKLTWRIIAPPGAANPKKDPSRLPKDEFERALLEGFASQPGKGRDGQSAREGADRLVDGGKEYQYYQPIRARKSCRPCHTPFGGESYISLISGAPPSPVHDPLPEGTLLAVVQVAIPNEPTSKAIAHHWALLAGEAVVATLLLMLAFAVAVRCSPTDRKAPAPEPSG